MQGSEHGTLGPEMRFKSAKPTKPFPTFGGVMSAHDDLEAALAALIVEQTGEEWPVTGWVLIAATTDPDTMTVDDIFWAVSEGQRAATSRGIVEQYRDGITADAIASIAYIPLDDDDDD